MYTTIIHPLRKMYHLSINEYCVLEAIRSLSNNIKYEGWCVLPIPKLASALDLSEQTIRRSYKKLEETNLAIRRWENDRDTAIRPCDEWNEWFMPEKAHILLGMKTNTQEIVGLIPHTEPTRTQNDDTDSGTKLRGGVVPNCKGGGTKLLPNTNKDTYKDTYIESPTEIEQAHEYGKAEINKMLEALKKLIGRDDFKESQQWQRRWGNHLCTLLAKIGKEEFRRRLEDLARDEFRFKNAGSLAYIYREIKASPVTKPKKLTII